MRIRAIVMEEFRLRQIQYLATALQRPAMGCGSNCCCEAFYRSTLNDLCWLDERERDACSSEGGSRFSAHLELGIAEGAV